MNTIKKEVAWFLIPTFLLTYGLGVITYILGGMEHFPLMIISMYIPASVVLGLYLWKFRKPIFKNNDLGLNFRNIMYWFIALLLMTFLVSLSYLIPFIFNNDFFKSTAQILEGTQKSSLGVGNWFLNLLIIFGINTFIAPFLNILIFLGEEIGWRAYLFPRLLIIYSPRKSFLITGSIWGLWHAGGILMGFNYPNNPLFGNVMMIAMCIPLGVIIQFVYFKSKNIIAAALAHGAMNWTTGNFIMFVIADKDYNKLVYGPTGIIGIAIFCIAAYFLFSRIDWHKENTYLGK